MWSTPVSPDFAKMNAPHLLAVVRNSRGCSDNNNNIACVNSRGCNDENSNIACVNSRGCNDNNNNDNIACVV